jgi:hypothetical protein
MGNTLPPPTLALIRELRRVARLLDFTAQQIDPAQLRGETFMRARGYAHTCWTAAARLEQLALVVEELTPAGARAPRCALHPDAAEPHCLACRDLRKEDTDAAHAVVVG